MKISQRITCALSFFTGIGILAQWVMVWTGNFPVAESVPGFQNYFLSFVIADIWLVTAALLTSYFIYKKNPKAMLFGIALGSSMLFFGLYSIVYDYNTGLLFNFSLEELFGKIITVYNIVFGFVFMFFSWKNRSGR